MSPMRNVDNGKLYFCVEYAWLLFLSLCLAGTFYHLLFSIFLGKWSSLYYMIKPWWNYGNSANRYCQCKLRYKYMFIRGAKNSVSNLIIECFVFCIGQVPLPPSLGWSWLVYHVSLQNLFQLQQHNYCFHCCRRVTQGADHHWLDESLFVWTWRT